MSKFKQVLLAIAITLVFAFFIGFGISTFYKSPKYEDFCEEGFYERPYPRPIDNSVNCSYIEADESLKNSCRGIGKITPKYDQKGCVESYYCETCYNEYDDVRENYNRNVFVVATGIGIIALIVGIGLKLASVSSGIMGGGILTIIYGTIRYWSGLQDYGRFIILGITLAILIWLGYKHSKKFRKKV